MLVNIEDGPSTWSKQLTARGILNVSATLVHFLLSITWKRKQNENLVIKSSLQKLNESTLFSVSSQIKYTTLKWCKKSRCQFWCQWARHLKEITSSSSWNNAVEMRFCSVDMYFPFLALVPHEKVEIRSLRNEDCNVTFWSPPNCRITLENCGRSSSYPPIFESKPRKSRFNMFERETSKTFWWLITKASDSKLTQLRWFVWPSIYK